MTKSSLSISETRWQEAQAWELRVWQRQQKLYVKLIKKFLNLTGIRCQQACKNDPLSALKNDPPGRGIK